MPQMAQKGWTKQQGPGNQWTAAISSQAAKGGFLHEGTSYSIKHPFLTPSPTTTTHTPHTMVDDSCLLLSAADARLAKPEHSCLLLSAADARLAKPEWQEQGGSPVLPVQRKSPGTDTRPSLQTGPPRKDTQIRWAVWVMGHACTSHCAGGNNMMSGATKRKFSACPWGKLWLRSTCPEYILSCADFFPLCAVSPLLWSTKGNRLLISSKYRSVKSLHVYIFYCPRLMSGQDMIPFDTWHDVMVWCHDMKYFLLFSSDLNLILKKSPFLVQEMVSIISQLIFMAKTGRGKKRLFSFWYG